MFFFYFVVSTRKWKSTQQPDNRLETTTHVITCVLLACAVATSLTSVYFLYQTTSVVGQSLFAAQVVVFIYFLLPSLHTVIVFAIGISYSIVFEVRQKRVRARASSSPLYSTRLSL